MFALAAVPTHQHAMLELPPWPLLVVWFAWAVQAGLSMAAVRKFLDGFERRHRAAFEGYHPPAAVIVPFKGKDTRLKESVQSLLTQDYPSYTLLLVVESQDDPAYPVLQDALATYPTARARIVIAGPGSGDQGQKIHNQLAAIDVLEQDPHDDGDTPEVWIFADSDAAPGPHWLGDMIGPLCRTKIGVTSGYRWLIPTEQGCVASFWSAMASVMNSSVACLLGRDVRNHAWGGSMAMRVETARDGNLRGMLTGAISDDYQVTRMCHNLGLRVYFVHRALVASPTSFSLRSLMEFGRRQHMITRMYAPRLYATSLILLTLYAVGSATSAGWLASALMGGTARSSWGWAGIAAFSVHLANHRRSSLRRKIIQTAFDTTTESRLQFALRLDRWFTSFWMTFHAILAMSAIVGRTLTWRNIRYRIDSRQQVRRLTD